MTLMEANLLRYLIEHEGKAVSRKTMLEQVWGLHEDTDTRAIDNFIVRLRRYLEDRPDTPRYLQTVRGMTPQAAGSIMLIQPVFQAVFSPVAGRISDKIEPRVPASIGMLLTSIGLLGLSFMDGNFPIPVLAGLLALLGFGFALFSSPNTNAIMSSVEKRFLGTASALVGAMRVIGQMLSMGAALLLFSLFIGHVKISPEQSGAFQTAMTIGFRIFALLCFSGIFISLARGNSRTETSP